MSSSVHARGDSVPAAYFVVDDDDRVLHVSAHFRDPRGISVGHVVWDHLPGARDVYGPHFEVARATGKPVDTLIYYAGRLKRLLAIPGSDGLAAHIENLAEIDVTSLATLTSSLARIEAELAGRASGQFDSRARASLQALP